MDQLEWRRRLGEQVAGCYADSPKVAATALGGSVARGWADDFSDVEVYVFWQDPPTYADRTRAVERSGGEIHVSWAEPDAFRTWTTAMMDTGGRVGEIWPHENDEWSEHYHIDQAGIGVSGFQVSTIDEWISGLEDGRPNDDAEMIAATLLADAHVSGKQLMESWVSRLTPFPETLALRVTERWLHPDRSWWSIDRLATRDDRPAFDVALLAMQRRLIRLLLAANGQYLPDPRPKWTAKLMAGFEVKPHDFLERMRRAQTSPPTEATVIVQELLEDTLGLLAPLYPTVDIDRALWMFRHRTPAVTEPPSPSG